MWFARRLRAMMPQDSLQLALTTGFGFSVLAGIFSGVVYIISVGYNKTKSSRIEKPNTPWHCSFCGTQFNSIGGVLEHENVATCMKCARTFCKEKCARRPKPGVACHAEEASRQSSNEDGSRRSSYRAVERWICKKCQPDSWITGIVRLLQFNETKEWYTKKMTTEQAQINAELTALQRKEREEVRDFIERLVEALLGGELDNVSVKKIYNDERYDALCARYHGVLSSALTDLGSALHITISNLPIAGDSPCAAHASLKTLIQRFIREASELPELKRDAEALETAEDSNDRTYEDLLSTAIINKVVQNYQEAPSIAGSSSNKSKRSVSDKEYFLGERNLDTASKYDDTSSLSSLDDYINTNGSTKYLDQMNFEIQQRSIKEVSSSDEERDEVDYNIDDFDSASQRNDWQENWYLRKRNFASGTNSPVPVPMLVPNPNASENAKVLIGDKEIDDTSDLSDALSDFEETAEPSSLNAVLINSKNLIGGNNPLLSMVAKAESIVDDDDEEDIPDSSKTQALIDVTEFTSSNEDAQDLLETCNQAFLRDAHDDLGACGDVEDQLISLESNTEKDSEYTEKYATLPRKIPMPSPRQSKLQDIDFSKTALLIEDSKTDNGDSGVTSDEDDKQKTFKGSSYGEREKDKWNHAVDLPNNPYSKSNLESRLSNRSNRSSSISSLNSVPSENALDADITESCETPALPVTSDLPLSSDLKNKAPPPLPKTPVPEMSKSLFDVFNDDRKEYHRYGRDYWAKAAGRPQGAMKKNWLDEVDPQKDGNIADDEDRKVEIVDDPIVPQENVYRAIPAKILDAQQEMEPQLVEDQFDDQSSIEVSTPTKRLQPWDLSSDSDYSIERTYNVNSGRIIKKLGDVEYELPVAEVPSAEGLKYTKLDENQNTVSKAPPPKEANEKRSNFLRSLTLEDEDPEVEDEEIVPPAVNHFKLVTEIANETVDQYRVEPISPPAEYKNIRGEKRHEVELENEEVPSIEYESEEKSYDFSINSTFEDEERQKAENNDDIVEESFIRDILDPPNKDNTKPTEQRVPIYEIIEESLNRGILDLGNEESADEPPQKIITYEIFEESLTRGIIEPLIDMVDRSEHLEIAEDIKQLLPVHEMSKEDKISKPTTPEQEHEEQIIDIEQAVNDTEEPITNNNLNKLLHGKSPLEQIDAEVDAHQTTSPEPEIEELKEKHLVKNLLGAFSKSFPNLSSISKFKETRQDTCKPLETNDLLSLSSDFVANSIEIEEASPSSPERVPSVKNLKKHFEKDTDVKKDVEVHSSLTARSVPKLMRQQLAEEHVHEKPRRHSMMSDASIDALEATAVDAESLKETVDSETRSEEIAFPITRNRIAFFEQMTRK